METSLGQGGSVLAEPSVPSCRNTSGPERLEASSESGLAVLREQGLGDLAKTRLTEADLGRQAKNKSVMGRAKGASRD